MNKIILMGRIAKDLELKTTAGGTNYCTFTFAVNRQKKKEDGNYETDFFKVIMFGKTAEIAFRTLEKGSKVLLEGAIHISCYTGKDGQKNNVAEVVAERFYYCERKKGTQTAEMGGEQ